MTVNEYYSEGYWYAPEDSKERVDKAEKKYEEWEPICDCPIDILTSIPGTGHTPHCPWLTKRNQRRREEEMKEKPELSK